MNKQNEQKIINLYNKPIYLIDLIQNNIVFLNYHNT